jgi:hypothetical protein
MADMPIEVLNVMSKPLSISAIFHRGASLLVMKHRVAIAPKQL